MPEAAVVFDEVWKKFRRGERHNSLRDLVPSLAKRLGGRLRTDDLQDQEFWVLSDVSFQVQKGEALGIIGPNGAGKSTTLKLLTKILKATRGRCDVRGRVGALIEVAAGFHPDLTGRENVFLQGAIMGMKHAEISEKFSRIVEFAGLEPFIETPVKRYSSGMNARLGFSIAAHLDPDVLIIDEVLAVGDMEFQRRCNERMLELKRNAVSLVLVSHNLAAVRDLCDRTLFLKQGAVQYLGATGDALQRYVSPVRAVSAGGGMGTRAPRVMSVTVPPDRDAMRLQPGDVVSLRLRVATNGIPRECVLTTYIVEQQNGVVAHNANQRLELSERLRDSGEVDVVIELRLNLLRGLYNVRFSLFDAATQEHNWIDSPVLLGIDELFSYGGTAHVPTRVSVQPADLPAPAAVGDTKISPLC